MRQLQHQISATVLSAQEPKPIIRTRRRGEERGKRRRQLFFADRNVSAVSSPVLLLGWPCSVHSPSIPHPIEPFRHPNQIHTPAMMSDCGGGDCGVECLKKEIA
ncbi:hypothetical protein Ddc_01928 [Ditylenchus destructor]|nr:hypothetical protein Ddc_01928 [Ditylenchus destructor]